MRSLTGLFVIILMVHQGMTQTPEIERLLKIAKESEGKEKILALSDVCKNFYYIDPHKGIDYGKQALELAVVLKLPSVKSTIYNNMGANYLGLNDINTARVYFDSALTNAIQFNDSLQIAIFFNRMGLLHETQGNFDSCLFFFNRELSVCQSLKNDERTGTVMENIGTIHMNRGELKSALTYLMEAKLVFEKANLLNKVNYVYLKLGAVHSESDDYIPAGKWFQKGVDLALVQKDFNKAGIGMNALGIIYKKQGKYDSALIKFDEALEILKNINNKPLTLGIYENIGNVYTSQEKYNQALKYHKKANALALELNRPTNLAINYVNLGMDYYGLKEYHQSRRCFEKALPVFTANKSQANLIITYKYLIDVNNALSDFPQSVKYYQLYNVLQDSLNRKELGTALDSLKVKFNTEQTEHENLFLKQESEIKTRTILTQQIIMVSSFCFLVLLTILAIVIVRSRQKIKQANELLGIKNLEISAKAEELRVINDKLMELSKFKDSMNSFLVHDLKNPLNTIVNFDPRQFSERQFEILKQSGKQMLNIVMNLLDISKYENRTMKISVENLSLTNIINKAFTDIEYLAEQKNIRLKLNYPNDFIAKADPEIIERVFVNLFSNAIKFSPAGDSIQIFAAYANQNHVKIIVKDHGEGIETSYLPRIFDKFSQAQDKKSGVTRSTGIGLTFCKLAIEAHAGEIGVDSEVGQGTSFWFSLPLAESQNGLQINPATISENSINFINLQLSDEEIQLLMPQCELLKKFHIYQVSDVKDIINTIDVEGSANISTWKSELLKAVSDCNDIKYNKLINLQSDGEL